jgi:hypothetical protein
MVLTEQNLKAVKMLLLDYEGTQIFEIVRHPVTNKLLHVLFDRSNLNETLLNKQVEIQTMK